MKKEMTAEEYLQRVLTGPVSEKCPMRRTLEMLGGKWRTHIIYELCKHETCRFGELKKAVPRITNTMLSSTLKDLEALGIIHREQFNEIPPHVEYSLTEKGRALLPVFTELAKWGENTLPKHDSSGTGQPGAAFFMWGASSFWVFRSITKAIMPTGT